MGWLGMGFWLKVEDEDQVVIDSEFLLLVSFESPVQTRCAFPKPVQTRLWGNVKGTSSHSISYTMIYRAIRTSISALQTPAILPVPIAHQSTHKASFAPTSLFLRSSASTGQSACRQPSCL